MDIKPCPFCGSKAKVTLFLGNYAVTCLNCPGAIIACPGQTEEEAIEAWDRRTDNGQTQAD